MPLCITAEHPGELYSPVLQKGSGYNVKGGCRSKGVGEPAPPLLAMIREKANQESVKQSRHTREIRNLWRFSQPDGNLVCH